MLNVKYTLLNITQISKKKLVLPILGGLGGDKDLLDRHRKILEITSREIIFMDDMENATVIMVNMRRTSLWIIC